MRSKLRKWNNKTKLINYDRNSRIIQSFIRPKLAKLLNDKIKGFFDDLAHKKVSKLLLTAGKMNKLLHALNRPSVQRFRNNLQKISSKRNFNDKLRIISNKNNAKNNTEKLRRYLNKWRDIKNTMDEKENNSASIIQRAFLRLLARTKRNNLQTKKTILTKYVIQKYNITNNKLYIYFTQMPKSFKAFVEIFYKNAKRKKNLIIK